jgi:peptidoglycan/xylan/chitin deacetylase (PgdA/CDA1 family)
MDGVVRRNGGGAVDDDQIGLARGAGRQDYLGGRKTEPLQRNGRPTVPHAPQRGPRSAARRRPLWLVLGLVAAVILGATSAFALGAMPLPFGASVAPRATATATFSEAGETTATPGPAGAVLDAPTASVTASVTATSGPTGPIPTINLGCPAGSLQPYSYVVRGGNSAHEIALTFDDGPSPDYTANMMSTLEQTHTLATFFVVGSNVDQYPDLVRRAAADGFGIGMHTYYHPYMTQLSTWDRAWQISETANAIHRALGPNYCLPYWRPPFGDWNSDVFSQMFAAGLTTITWDTDPADWSAPGVQTIIDRIVAGVHGGAIILCHDGYNFRWQTAQALPQIISKLKAMGYTFVTIPQLLGLPQPHAEPGSATTPTPSPATSSPTPTPTPSPTPGGSPTGTPTALDPARVA